MHKKHQPHPPAVNRGVLPIDCPAGGRNRISAEKIYDIIALNDQNLNALNALLALNMSAEKLSSP